tara:strand:- start:1735 stop:2625 length:891 start_codon:yes stop_codon:yes gene_type:complete
MLKRHARVLALSILAFAVAPATGTFVAAAADDDLIARGGYLVTAGGCISCHTDYKKKGKPFAGGAAIPTPFGTFYPPNITPDKTHGIGGWSDADFIRAMRDGKNPDGAHYFPAFPYTSYTRIAEPDLIAMKAYLFSLPAVAEASTPHDISFPFSWRFLQTGWKLLFFRNERFTPDTSKSAEVNRGAYLANALAHCGECHTPRNILGGLDYDRWMAGTPDGPEGEKVPNLTPAEKTGLKWTGPEIVEYLKSGQTPEFDFAGSLMADVIEHNTGKMTQADRVAIAAYLKSLKPVETER